MYWNHAYLNFSSFLPNLLLHPLLHSLGFINPPSAICAMPHTHGYKTIHWILVNQPVPTRLKKLSPPTHTHTFALKPLITISSKVRDKGCDPFLTSIVGYLLDWSQVGLMQHLWDHEYFGSTISRRHRFPQILPDLWLLNISVLSSPMVLEPYGLMWYWCPICGLWLYRRKYSGLWKVMGFCIMSHLLNQESSRWSLTDIFNNGYRNSDLEGTLILIK